MFEKYRIRNDITLDELAKLHQTNKEYIMDLNNLSFGESLREGMDIIVPKNKSKYFDTYTINKGDTLYEISKKYNINPELLATLNGLNMDDYIYPGQIILLPIGKYSYYVTAEGDTIDLVSEMFKKNKEELLKENETIYLLPGQILVSIRK